MRERSISRFGDCVENRKMKQKEGFCVIEFGGGRVRLE